MHALNERPEQRVLLVPVRKCVGDVGAARLGCPLTREVNVRREERAQAVGRVRGTQNCAVLVQIKIGGVEGIGRSLTTYDGFRYSNYRM